jgi:hypothetical protein
MSDSDDDTWVEEEEEDTEEETEQLPVTYLSPSFAHKSKLEIRDMLLYNLDYHNQKEVGVKKNDLRSLLMYFRKDLESTATRISIALSDEALAKYMSTHFENMQLKDYIKDQYWGYVSCLIEFFLLIQDFESILILLPDPPKNTPSPKVESAVLFVKLKGDARGTELKNSRGESVKDLCGSPITCLGLWHTIGSFTVFSAALSGCVQSRNQRTGYTAICELCHKNYTEWAAKKSMTSATPACVQHYPSFCSTCNFCDLSKRSWEQEAKTPPHGCIHHSHTPRFFPIGNPFARNQDWKNCKSIMKELVKNHKSSPCSMLTPFEVKKIIAFLIYSNDLYSFQMAVAIVIGVRCYFREKELASIQFEHFKWNLCSLSV